MKTNKNILLLLLVFKSMMMIAQDTIFVYDTIIVYDTVYIYDTIRTEQLNLDTNNINSLETNKSTAEEPSIKDSSTTSSKLDLEKEKNKSNNSFGVKLGTVLFGTNDNVQNISNPKTLGGKIGFYYRYSINKKIGVRCGVDYLYNSNNKKAKAKSSDIDNSSKNYLSLFNEEEAIGLQDSSIGDIRNLHIITYHGQLAIPIFLEINFNKISPFIGIEYRYKLYEGIAYDSFRNDWGAKFGVTYKAYQKIEFMLNIYKGLTNEQESIVGVKLNSYSLGCSILFQF